jgi:hypothetical protein
MACDVAGAVGLPLPRGDPHVSSQIPSDRGRGYQSGPTSADHIGATTSNAVTLSVDTWSSGHASCRLAVGARTKGRGEFDNQKLDRVARERRTIDAGYERLEMADRTLIGGRPAGGQSALPPLPRSPLQTFGSPTSKPKPPKGRLRFPELPVRSAAPQQVTPQAPQSLGKDQNTEHSSLPTEKHQAHPQAGQSSGGKQNPKASASSPAKRQVNPQAPSSLKDLKLLAKLKREAAEAIKVHAGSSTAVVLRDLKPDCTEGVVPQTVDRRERNNSPRCRPSVRAIKKRDVELGDISPERWQLYLLSVSERHQPEGEIFTVEVSSIDDAV